MRQKKNDTRNHAINHTHALDTFLARLSSVRQPKPGHWTARCPAHEDRTPSLSVTSRDGVILVRCWAGCSFRDIAAAVGMEPTEFFPPREDHRKPIPASMRWIPRQTLEGVAHELAVVVVAARRTDQGPLPPADAARLDTAVERISSALREAGIHG